MNSLAPSGVDLNSIGVSTSTKPVGLKKEEAISASYG
jgi:hypothetical protein